ncbi:hypothetical protein L6255_01940 [Candidatus Parcubacteria bacterium]|nr:hypothetical protein [Patescibacteria group bacterium]MBU4381101.1 hypothetical protein [Patescibacteria group bacterium]MCG2689176.1 hypothetical protein [Candidatus Parcubacteria bacterium]
MQITTVSLFEQLAKTILDYYLKGFKTLDNTRPLWTNGLEIDRYYPQLGVAIEFQGPQHYKQIEAMQTPEKFQNQLRADSLKRQACLGQGISYLPLPIFSFSESSYRSTIEQIKNAGTVFAKKNNDITSYNQLSRMLVGKYPDQQIFRRIEGIKNKR